MKPARMSRYGAVLVAAAAFSLGGMAPASAAAGGNGNGNAWGLQDNANVVVGNGGGANAGCGPYCPNNVGAETGNGGGNSNTPNGAGTRGAADGKYPPGQEPGGGDDNNGYECDGNNGVGKTNPAHTGCESSYPPPDDGGNGDT